MAERYRATSHKAIKRLIASGNYDDAEQALLTKRHSLLTLLENPECDEAKIELFLTCTNSLLAECYSKAGRIGEAEAWFEHAFNYCRESHDPMVRMRLHRIYAMHHCRTGRYDDALAEIEGVIHDMYSPDFENESRIPADRIEIELAYSVSCKAEIMLTQYPGHTEGIASAHSVRPHLRHGSKRRYELQNLMVCISATNRLTAPLLYRRLIMRAWYVNERFVHSGHVRTRLIDADMVVPVASLTRSAFSHIIQ